MRSVGLSTVCVLVLYVGNALAQNENEHAAAARSIVAAHTDFNADGVIDEAELAQNVAAAFVALDVDASGTLTPEELASHEADAFARVDADGDGSLTFIEVMEAKTADMAEVDKDGDGALSPDELIAMDELR